MVVKSVRLLGSLFFILGVGVYPLAAQAFFYPYASGDSPDQIWQKIEEDPLLLGRENQVTLSVPTYRDGELFYEIDNKVRAIEVEGNPSFIKRISFYFKEERLYSMTINFSTGFTNYYAIFSSLKEKLGEPFSVKGPNLIEWKAGNVLVRLERPLTVKYIDISVIEELKNQYDQDQQNKLDIKESILERL